MMKLNATNIRTIIISTTLLLCVAWGIGVWIYERDQYRDLANNVVTREAKNGKSRAETISADIQRSLRVMRGLPEVLASWQELVQVVSAHNRHEHVELTHVNHLLALANNDFSSDVVWIVDPNGDCIAASNFDLPTSFVGTNFRERSYFTQAIKGENGYQFAVGKISHQPGLYLSSPIFSGADIVGVVVVKIEIVRLGHNIDFTNAFLVDENGVVILSEDNYLFMKAVPGNIVTKMPYERRISIYARDQFEAISIQPWPDYSDLVKIDNSPEPFALNITNINKGELRVYVLSPAKQILQLNDEFTRLFLLSTSCGVAVLFIFAGVALYVHSRHLVNQVLRMQHEELDEAQRLAKVGSWSYNYVTGQLHCSRELITNFFMLEPDNIKIKPTLDYFLANMHPDDRDRVEGVLSQGLSSGQGFHIEYRMLRNNGEVRNVIANAIVEKNSKGQRIKATGTCRDVTEEQRTLRALEDSENHLRRVLNSSLIGIIQGNDTGRILDMNQAFKSLTGYDTANLAEGKLKWKDLAPPQYQELNGPAIFGLTNTPSPFEMPLTTHNGKTIAALIGLARVEDARSEWVCFVLDLSERNRVNRLQSEFISIVSHELRTPLTSIRGSLSLLESGVLDGAVEQKTELIKIAHRNSQRLIKIVNDILDMEKLAAGEMVFAMQSVDLAAMIVEAIEFNSGFAQQYNVHFVMHEFPENAFIHCDPHRLMQVLTNLMSNAAKFSKEGDNVDLRLIKDQGHWRVEIEDHGDGISAEFRTRIFSAFAQAEDANVRQKGGTGLGLNISKIMVEKMNGEIGFESEEGYGTTFWISFPRQEQI